MDARSQEVMISSGEEVEEEEEEEAVVNRELLAAMESSEKEACNALTLLDLLYAMWNPTFSALHNLRLIIAFVGKYLMCQKKATDVNSRRLREGIAMRGVYSELLDAWAVKGPSNSACSKETLQDHVSEYRALISARDGSDPFSRVTLTERTFMEWIDEYRVYTKSLFLESATRRRTTSTAAAVAVAGTSTDGDNDYALFDASIFKRGEKRSGDEEHRIPQYITRLQGDGTLHTWRTPGESGSLLMRLDVYNVRDIADKDKRNWWKYARVRSQFLSSVSRPEKLQELLNEAARGMSKVPGLMCEERKVAH